MHLTPADSTHEPHAHGSLAEHRAVDDAICLDQVSFAYSQAGGRTDRGLACGVTLHVPQGSSLGIIGPNGAGKTTLLKIMLGLLSGYRGHVRLMGLRRSCFGRGDIVGYVPQRHDAEWRFPLTVRQVARMGLVGKTGPVRWYSRADRQYVEQLLGELGIVELADQPIGELSGGQQQRCFMARALAARPKILILDEPLVGINDVGQRQFAELIRRLHRQLELTLVIVSHDLRAIATQLHAGRLLEPVDSLPRFAGGADGGSSERSFSPRSFVGLTSAAAHEVIQPYAPLVGILADRIVSRGARGRHRGRNDLFVVVGHRGAETDGVHRRRDCPCGLRRNRHRAGFGIYRGAWGRHVAD